VPIANSRIQRSSSSALASDRHDIAGASSGPSDGAYSDKTLLIPAGAAAGTRCVRY